MAVTGAASGEEVGLLAGVDCSREETKGGRLMSSSPVFWAKPAAVLGVLGSGWKACLAQAHGFASLMENPLLHSACSSFLCSFKKRN